MGREIAAVKTTSPIDGLHHAVVDTLENRLKVVEWKLMDINI